MSGFTQHLTRAAGTPRLPGGLSDATFGPVPSRRLGRSLGINNIPPKACTYSWVDCQVGRTLEMRCAPCGFLPAQDVAAAVQRRPSSARRAGEAIDHLTVVPDREPTLDLALGDLLRLLHPLGVPRAVITNRSLLHTETMLVDGVNDGAHEVFRAFAPRVELLLGYEGDAFASTEDPVADLLSITAVHPMREGAVRRLMSRRHAPWAAVTDLAEQRTLGVVPFGPHRYYVHTVPSRRS